MHEAVRNSAANQDKPYLPAETLRTCRWTIEIKLALLKGRGAALQVKAPESCHERNSL